MKTGVLLELGQIPLCVYGKMNCFKNLFLIYDGITFFLFFVIEHVAPRPGLVKDFLTLGGMRRGVCARKRP